MPFAKPDRELVREFIIAAALLPFYAAAVGYGLFTIWQVADIVHAGW